MLLAAFLAVLFLRPDPVPGAADSQSSPSSATQQSTASDAQPTRSDTGLITFHVTTREVLLDLIALDRGSRPVLDLKPADLRITEAPLAESGKKHRHRHAPALEQEVAPITSLRVEDPSVPAASAGDRAGFQIAASCLERSALHYQLAFRPGPNGWASGYHEVAVTTTRRDVRLFYRHRYFVGVTAPPAHPLDARRKTIEKILQRAACYYPDTPPSISLRARLIDTGRADWLRYSVSVDAGSLSFLTLATGPGSAADPSSRQPMTIDRRVEIDYGVCTFDTAGRPIRFFSAPVDQALNSADYARALEHGFPHLLEFSAPPSLGLTRFVVRDRETGNLGATDVAFATASSTAGTHAGSASNLADGASILSAAPDSASTSARASGPERLTEETNTDLDLYPRFLQGDYVRPPRGPIGSFGSIVPAPHAFCGDVYELPDSSRLLPDFRELDPIGSLYASTLDVPSQDFTTTDGIPGVTPRTNLFGIDYHATFWIRDPGDYKFRMVSDDGAKLWIDDQQVVDLDGLHSARGAAGRIHLEAGQHSMHVPYYQGAVFSVALILWVKAPGEVDWRLFDLRDFPSPEDHARN